MKLIKEDFNKRLDLERRIADYRNKRLAESFVEEVAEQDIEEEPNLEIEDTVEEILPSPQTDDGLIITNNISALIKDEWEAIDGYHGAIATCREIAKKENGDNSIDYDAIIKILEDITQEEMNHVGMLQQAMSTIAPSTAEIAEGEEEAKEVLEDSGSPSDEESEGVTKE